MPSRHMAAVTLTIDTDIRFIATAQAQIKRCDTPDSLARERCDCQNTERAGAALISAIVHRITCACPLVCRPIEWLKLASVNEIRILAHDKWSVSQGVFLVDSGVCPRTPQTQTQQQSQLYAAGAFESACLSLDHARRWRCIRRARWSQAWLAKRIRWGASQSAPTEPGLKLQELHPNISCAFGIIYLCLGKRATD